MDYSKLSIIQDFNKDGKDVAVDLINVYNKTYYRPHKVKLGEPSKLDMRPDIDWDENTYVPIQRSMDEAILTGSTAGFGLLYKRFNIQEVYNIHCIEVEPEELPCMASDLLDKINKQINIKLTKKDIKDVEIDAVGKHDVLISKKSYAWYGSFCINVPNGVWSVLLDKTDLDGFKLFLTSDELEDDPYSGSSIMRFQSLMNSENNTGYTYDIDYTLEDIEEIPPGSNFNTKVTFKPINNSKEEQTIRYKRLSIDALSQLESHPTHPTELVNVPFLPFTTYDLLEEINDKLKINLQQDELENIIYTEYDIRYPLKIKDNTSSIAWFDSTYNFRVNHPFIPSEVRASDDNQFRITENGQLRQVL